MTRLRLLVREPALLLNLAENFIAVLVVLNINVTHDQETWIMAALVAVIGILKGLATHPFPVHFITDLARAVLMCAIAFGLNLSPDKAAVIVTFVGTATALIGSVRTTPSYDPVERPGGAGGGPVSTRTEAGYGALGLIGIVLVIIGVLDLLLLALGTAFLPLIVALLLIVFGAVLFIVDGRSGTGRYRL